MSFKIIKYAILVMLILTVLLSCTPKPVIFGVEDGRFSKVGSDSQQYFIRLDGVSCTLMVSATKSRGMKILFSLRNNRFPRVIYFVDQLMLKDSSGEKNIAAVYVDNQKADMDYQCKIYKDNHVDLLYIIEGTENDEIGTEYMLSPGKIIIGRDEKVELNDIKIISKFEE